MIITPKEDELAHIGIIRRSGRYPWGSGKDPYQRSVSFQSIVKDLQSKGMSEVDIARGFGMTTTEFRAAKSAAKTARQAEEIAMVRKLDAKGMSQSAIAERLGISGGTVRNYLKPDYEHRATDAKKTTDFLKAEADKHKYIDIGSGTELTLGISATTLKMYTEMMKEQGYTVEEIHIPQLDNPKNTTTTRVLLAPGVTKRDAVVNMGDIHVLGVRTAEDGTRLSLLPPKSISSKRISVRYDEDGGSDMDGVIELRRDAKDLSLGKSNYAQVRIAVDGTHYLKGVAIYADDLPKGVDIRFNTNKKKGTPLISDDGECVLKKMKSDPDNPFGATIRRQVMQTVNGKSELSPLNIVNEEGNWKDWKKVLSSQFLSKQPITLAQQQLRKAADKKQQSFDEIMRLENPVLRKRMLFDLADSCDSSALNLQGAALPRQASFLILPVPTLSPKEVYAPHFRDGEKVALVRYPHGGTFEIPIVTVNNKHAGAKRTLGASPLDAIGIHPKVAERLSGADFDGDTIVAIPAADVHKIRSTSPLKGLEGFNPSRAYPRREGMPVLTERTKGIEMGKVSNLITDMTLKGASEAELTRAVRHSMVVIDAVKHKLDYKTSEADNGIKELREKYQNGGRASTIISRAKNPLRIPERKLRSAAKGGAIDPKTGRKVYEETGSSYTVIKEFKTKPPELRTVKRMIEVPQMDLVTDAHKLSSGTPMEGLYADYANEMKALASRARREALATPAIRRSPKAAQEYAAEVDQLNRSIKRSLANAPRERQAQLIAGGVAKAKIAANPDLTKDDKAKIKHQALLAARERTGASRAAAQFQLTDRQWEAIKAGAISNAMLEAVVRYAEPERLRELAMPKEKPKLSPNTISRARAMARNGSTTSEIADALGISTASALDALGR